VKEAAASTDGLLAVRCGRAAAICSLGFGLAGAGAGLGGCTGPTSVPTGWTRPFAAKPQLSSFSAESISVRAGQCSSVTISVTPSRLAIPT
jgi:hypothetical protein